MGEPERKPESAPVELPIACSLDREALVERAELLRRIGAAGLLDTRRSGPTLTLLFVRDVTLRSALERFVALERDCCPFLDFTISEVADELQLLIYAPPEAGAVLDAIAVATTGRKTAH